MTNNTTDIILNDDCLIDDEGIVLTIEEARRSLTSGSPLLVNGSLNGQLKPLSKGSEDSGFSSRMSENDAEERERAGQLLLVADQQTVLRKRLTRISECQYDSSCRCTPLTAVKTAAKIFGVFFLLYFFICTLDLLSNAFNLLGGKTAGTVFQDSALLYNPITGLMIGVLSTVILQSSSTSSSIVITMVASNIIDIRPAIPIIMGANIGTTVTNTLVSLAHSTDRKEFRRAFSGAVVHDVFNWLTVLILLPAEKITGFLYTFTSMIVDSMDLDEMKAKNQDLLKTLTKPLTKQIVQIDKSVITGIAEGKTENFNKSILKIYCSYETTETYQMVNQSSNATGEIVWSMVNTSVATQVPGEKCDALFSMLGWDDSLAGTVLFLISIVSLSLCLYSMVKLLHSLMGGHIAKAARKTINADFPGPFRHLTGYAAIVVGAIMTILVQSSSVFTSALTPLVGIGCLKLERMFPLTLGSNIGTTFTGILAALAASSATMKVALQLAFCHLFFNICGILLFYPIPRMRQVVLGGARFLGRTTAKYRWFAIAYLICMFLLFPGFFFVVSFAGPVVFYVSVSILGALSLFVVVVNIMQGKVWGKKVLPRKLHSWKFLPEFMRSLAPLDRLLNSCVSPLTSCCCQCCVARCSCLKADEEDCENDSYLYTDDEDSDGSVLSSALPSSLPSTVSSRANLMPTVQADKRIYKPRNGKYSPVANSERQVKGERPIQVQIDIPENMTPEQIANISESVI